jgi:hypothetical protein
MPNNFDRMVKLAVDFFDTKNDPMQIVVNEEVIKKLRQIHPNSLTQEEDANGPTAWILVIPTTNELMKDFLAHKISERELLEKTSPGLSYSALYLCSALVLPECRGKGLAKRLTVKAVQAIKRDHPIQQLFYWSFSSEGDKLAAAVSKECGLPISKRGD